MLHDPNILYQASAFQRNQLLPLVLRCSAYIDTIEVFFRQLPAGLIPALKAVNRSTGKLGKVFARKCVTDGFCWGWMVVIQQPTRQAIWVLYRGQLHHDGKLSRFDVAADLICDQPKLLQDWLGKHCLLRWRRKGWMLEVDDEVRVVDPSLRLRGTSTLYWTEQFSRIDEGKHRSRDLVAYVGKSKLTGEPCCRFELRCYGGKAIKEAGYEDVIDLANINLSELFQHHVKLVQYETEAFIEPRALHVFKLLTQNGRAQRIKDTFPELPSTPVDFSVLKLPTKLSYHSVLKGLVNSPTCHRI